MTRIPAHKPNSKLKTRMLFTIFLLLLFFQSSFSAPKEEFRAVWVTTVSRLDWPSSSTVSIQQSEMIQILNNLQDWNFNAIIFQVRPACDAFYASSIEPWSNWLSGTEGVAPSPYYDPLQFVIDEARKRDIEVHAWFNPYRVKTGNAGTSSGHVYNTHPEWVLTVGSKSGPDGLMRMDERDLPATKAPTYILDPGMADVRDYVLSVIADVANRYDIDGVHLDDYFYPYSGMGDEDAQTFSKESRGYTDLGDWRRDNVNLLIQGIQDTLLAIDPWIKFGMSPFGIWKNGVPTGITGMDAYNVIYCDAITWLNEQWVDYLAPQLYWPFGGGQDYGLLMPWWAGYAEGNARHLYPGHAAYKANDWANNEIPRQVRLNRDTVDSPGSMYFRYAHMISNYKGFRDSLETSYYKYPAVPPRMPWKDTQASPPPAQVQMNYSGSDAVITWEHGDLGGYNDEARRYLVYKWPATGTLDTGDPSQIAAIIPASETLTYTDSDHEDYLFGVASQDRLSNESPHVMPDYAFNLDLSFEDDGDVSNWGNHDESDVGTVVSWNGSGGVNGSGALNFTDPGWTFLIKRPVNATSHAFYTLSVDVKTESWTHATNTLNLYVSGLSSSEPSAVVSTHTTYTTVTLTGVADAGTAGYIRFHGVNNGNPISLWIDNLSFTVEAPEIQAVETLSTGSGISGQFSGTNISLYFGSVSTGGSVRVSRFDSGPVNLSFSGTPPQNVSTYRWIINPGDLAFSNGTINISIDGLSGIAHPQTVDIWKRDTPGSGSFVKLAASYEGGILSAPVSSFSEFILGSENDDNSLPVCLTSFTAKPVKGTVVLKWETSAEIENQGFVLSRKSKVESQKSEIIADFTTDDALKGQGSTTETTKYAFTDKSVEPGKTYVYTLADVDYSGNETILEKVEVTVEDEDAIVADGYALSPVYPNPFNATLTVPFTLTEPMTVSIELYSLTGQRMMTVVNRDFGAGSYNYTVNANDLASGVYFVRTVFNGRMHMQKAVLLK